MSKQLITFALLAAIFLMAVFFKKKTENVEDEAQIDRLYRCLALAAIIGGNRTRF